MTQGVSIEDLIDRCPGCGTWEIVSIPERWRRLTIRDLNPNQPLTQGPCQHMIPNQLRKAAS